jgi:hypothetical protein
VLHDKPGKYYLGTHEVRAKDGYRTGLGGVELKKSYVSVHLVPVYVDPSLLDVLSPALKERMRRKSCFNVMKPEPALIAELTMLIDRGGGAFEAAGKFRKPSRLRDRGYLALAGFLKGACAETGSMNRMRRGSERNLTAQ